MISPGFVTLLQKEVRRYWKVAMQTISAPIVTALLYLLVFGHAMEARVLPHSDISFMGFLVPGLVMMSVLQNAFANSSSSLIQSKITGSMVFLLLSPISNLEIFFAYLLAAMMRGLTVGVGVYLVTLWFAPLACHSFIWIVAFSLLGSALLGTMGIIAGIWADRYEHLATFQNFLIMPATFLSGVFYSTHALPEFWRKVSQCNPFFYIIDGFRYGLIGHSDVNPLVSLLIVGVFCLVLSAFTIRMLQSGYKLRH